MDEHLGIGAGTSDRFVLLCFFPEVSIQLMAEITRWYFDG